VTWQIIVQTATEKNQDHEFGLSNKLRYSTIPLESEGEVSFDCSHYWKKNYNWPFVIL